MHARNVLYSADPGVGQPSGLRVSTWFGTARDGHLRDKAAAHIDGGAARLTEARVSIMQRKTKRRPDAFAAERRRAAPYTRPDKISASMFPLVRATRQRTPEPLLLHMEGWVSLVGQWRRWRRARASSRPVADWKPVAFATALRRYWNLRN